MVVFGDKVTKILCNSLFTFLLSKSRQAKTKHVETKISQPIFGILVVLTKNELTKICNEPSIKKLHCLQIVEDVIQERRIHQINANPSLCQEVTVSPLRIRNAISLSRSERTSGRQTVIRGTTENPPLTVLNTSLETVLAKMASATDSLAETDDIEVSRQLVLLIKDCADCVQSLKSASSMHQ